MVVVKEDRSWLPHIKTRNRSWGCALLAKHLPSVASGPVSEPQHCQNLKITPMHETTAKRTSVHCHRRVCVAAGLTAVGGRCVEQGSLQTDTEIPGACWPHCLVLKSCSPLRPFHNIRVANLGFTGTWGQCANRTALSSIEGAFRKPGRLAVPCGPVLFTCLTAFKCVSTTLLIMTDICFFSSKIKNCRP